MAAQGRFRRLLDAGVDGGLDWRTGVLVEPSDDGHGVARAVDHAHHGSGCARQLALVGLFDPALAHHVSGGVERAEALELLGGDRADRPDDVGGQFGGERAPRVVRVEHCPRDREDDGLELLVSGLAQLRDLHEPGRVSQRGDFSRFDLGSRGPRFESERP